MYVFFSGVVRLMHRPPVKHVLDLAREGAGCVTTLRSAGFCLDLRAVPCAFTARGVLRSWERNCFFSSLTCEKYCSTVKGLLCAYAACGWSVNAHDMYRQLYNLGGRRKAVTETSAVLNVMQYHIKRAVEERSQAAGLPHGS